MRYIERLQEDKRILLDFFNLYNLLENKEKTLENTPYKGDALKEANAARAQFDIARGKVIVMLDRATSTKEVKND